MLFEYSQLSGHGEWKCCPDLGGWEDYRKDISIAWSKSGGTKKGMPNWMIIIKET